MVRRRRAASRPGETPDRRRRAPRTPGPLGPLGSVGSIGPAGSSRALRRPTVVLGRPRLGAREAAEAPPHPVTEVTGAARDVVDQLHQRVLGAAHMRGVVGRRLPEGVPHRGVPVLVAARVVAVHDPLVVPGGRPLLQLGGPHGGEGVRAGQHVQDLQHRVAQVAARLVLLGLLQERVHVHLVQVVAARDLHQAPHGGLEVLADQQSRAVGGQLRLAEPLAQRGHDRHDRHVAQRDPGDPDGEGGQEEQDRPVDRVPGQGVPDLVPDDRPHLLLVEQLDQARGDDDDRLVQADAHRVRHRVLVDVHRGTFSRSRM